MSQLIQLRNRIKAVEITRKTTNAMRLIAMSAHTRLRQAKDTLDNYNRELERLLKTVTHLTSRFEEKREGTRAKQLIVIVGSQKGLCGTFNTHLAHQVAHLYQQRSSYFDIISVGKQMKEALKHEGVDIYMSYDEFSYAHFITLADEFASFVLSSLYTEVIFHFTKAKSFFSYVPESQIFRKELYHRDVWELGYQGSNDMILEQSYPETFNAIALLSLKARIEYIFLESLVAEQAQRFVSMDLATRNADDLINQMKLSYNKLRQTIITRELTDLAGNIISESINSAIG